MNIPEDDNNEQLHLNKLENKYRKMNILEDDNNEQLHLNMLENKYRKMNITEDDNNEQIVPRKEAEDTSTKTLPEKEQMVFLPFYSKSYSRTQFESIKFDHTWEMDRFYYIIRALKLIVSAPIPQTGQCYIHMNIDRKNEEKIVSLYVRVKKEFLGLSFIISMQPMSITKFGLFESSDTLLCELKAQSLDKYLNNDTFTLRFQFEIFHTLQTNIICANSTPSSAIFSEDQTSENTILHDSKSDDIKSIKIIINRESYIVPKDLLDATNSAYFKTLCNTKKEINMAEFIPHDELEVFEDMLLFIITGKKPSCLCYESISIPLLKVAHKYDVCDLKLICEQHLVDWITLENAVQMIQLAFSCNAQFLEKYALSFIKFHMEKIADTKEFQNLPQEYLEKLMKLIEISKKCDELCINVPLTHTPFRIQLTL